MVLASSAITRTLSEAFDGDISSKSESVQWKRRKIVSPQLCEFIEPRFFVLYELADKVSIIQVMKQQESTVYKPSEYSEQTAITSDFRRAMCQWGYDIVDACKKDPVLAEIAIRYFDRLMSKRSLRIVDICMTRPREFQLAFMVSSWHLLVPAPKLLSHLCICF